jgi:hypothetical protein
MLADHRDLPRQRCAYRNDRHGDIAPHEVGIDQLATRVIAFVFTICVSSPFAVQVVLASTEGLCLNGVVLCAS